MKYGRPRWILAELALDHFQKFREPVGRLLKATAIEYAATINLGERQTVELQQYCNYLLALQPIAPESVTEKVVRYKQEHIKAATLQEMVELQASGMLSNEKWYEITQKALLNGHASTATTNYLDTLQDRMSRRRQQLRYLRRPWTYIDPLDNLIQGLGPKELGMILAPYKRGKSLMLQWLAVAYVLQRLNVLYITLENAQASVEDRLDSIVSHIPIKVLSDYPKTLTQRFEKFKNLVHRQLKIYDGTTGGVTVPFMEQLIQAERNRGFLVDALIVDYDDEIQPTVKQKDRRFEFADIYRDLRQLAARYNIIIWTAAQTQRDTEHLKVISGDRAAEDISKLRKVTLALSLGKGEWNNGESIYLWVAAANENTSHVGCHIVPDRKRMLIYDREATVLAARRNGVTP